MFTCSDSILLFHNASNEKSNLPQGQQGFLYTLSWTVWQSLMTTRLVLQLLMVSSALNVEGLLQTWFHVCVHKLSSIYYLNKQYYSYFRTMTANRWILLSHFLSFLQKFKWCSLQCKMSVLGKSMGNESSRVLLKRIWIFKWTLDWSFV